MTLNQFLTILKARRWLILSIFGLIVVTATTVGALMPKSYTSTAAVVLDVKSPDPIAGMILPGMMQPGYMATQLDLIRSERVARGVIKKLRLIESRELQQQWDDKTSRQGSFESWLSDLLLQNLDVKPSKESNVIYVSYTGAEPNFAAAMANAFVESYIQTSLELRVEPAKQFRVLFDEQAKQARDRLEAAQNKLAQFQKENSLLVADERMDIENARLAELSSQLVAIQSISSESTSRKNQAATSGDRMQEVLTHPVVANLITEQTRQEARLKELQSRYGESHPQVQELMANINELKARITQESSRIAASIGLNSNVNQSREAQARYALEQQRSKVLQMKSLRDQANVLGRDIETAQRAYDAIVARRDQTALESQSTQTNVSVVKTATAQFKPSGPKLLIIIPLAFAVGLIFAIGFVTTAELIDRRLRSDDDIRFDLDLPLLGRMPEAYGRASKVSKVDPLLQNKRSPRLNAPAA